MLKKEFIEKINSLESWQSLCLVSKKINKSVFISKKKNNNLKIEFYNNNILKEVKSYDTDSETIEAIYPSFKTYTDVDNIELF